MRETLKKNFFNLLMILTTALGVVLIIYLYREGMITDPDKMKEFIEWFGVFAPIAFVVIYILSIVFPIIPGGMLNVIGVLLFAPMMGFVYNYIGSVTGSYLAYLISQRYGERVVIKFVGEEKYRKQVEWLNAKHHFDITFAVMILLPFFPDDLMCYIAGLTDTGHRKFLLLLAPLKIPSILIYSFGMSSFIDLIR